MSVGDIMAKYDLDYGYGMNNVFWKNILGNCSKEEEKIVRSKLKEETPNQYKEFQELEKQKKN